MAAGDWTIRLCAGGWAGIRLMAMAKKMSFAEFRHKNWLTPEQQKAEPKAKQPEPPPKPKPKG